MRIPRVHERPDGLGDMLERELTRLGITQDKYIEAKRLFGLPPICNCIGRREWINKVGRYFGIGT